jgi:hypothetical protein
VFQEAACENLCYITRSKNSNFHTVLLFLVQSVGSLQKAILALASENSSTDNEVSYYPGRS